MEGNSDVGDQNGNKININNNINDHDDINNNINHNINNNANKININNIVNGGNLSPIWNDRRLLKTCFVAVVLAVAVTWLMGWRHYCITVPLSLHLAMLAIILDERRQQREQNHRREAQKGVRVCVDVSTMTLQGFLEYLELVNFPRGTVNLQDLRREHWEDRSTETMKDFLGPMTLQHFLQWIQRYGDIQESDGPSTTPNYSNRQSTDTVPT